MDNYNQNNFNNNSFSNTNNGNNGFNPASNNVNNGFNPANQINNNMVNNQNNFNSNNYNNANNTSNSVNSNVAKPKTSKNAICSLVFAVVSLFIFWWLSLAAISTGIVALREIKVKNEKGKGLAIAGIVIGVICELLYWYGEIMLS